MTYDQPPGGGQPWSQQAQPYSQYPPQQQYPPPGYAPQPQYPPGYPPPGHRQRKSWPRRHKVLTAIMGLFGFFVAVGVVANLGQQPSQQSSLSSQADAVMQLNDTPFDVTQSPGSGDIQVINSAAKAFNAAVTVTNDPTQQDTDYTNIGYDLGQVQQDIQASSWMQYYTDLGQARSDIQSARADGTLSGP